MQLIDELRAEHDLIDQVLGSFCSFLTRWILDEADPSDGGRFLLFFRVYLGEFHHSREEDTLFHALAAVLHLPSDRGPILALTADHHRLSGILDQIGRILGEAVVGEADATRLRTLIKEYSQGLRHHIDAENSVLLPECEVRLRKRGFQELPVRPLLDREREAKATGEELLRLYPPALDPGIIRGDGCAMCPAYVDSCQGIEREWWNEWEWEEFGDHLPAG